MRSRFSRTQSPISVRSVGTLPAASAPIRTASSSVSAAGSSTPRLARKCACNSARECTWSPSCGAASSSAVRAAMFARLGIGSPLRPVSPEAYPDNVVACQPAGAGAGMRRIDRLRLRGVPLPHGGRPAFREAGLVTAARSGGIMSELKLERSAALRSGDAKPLGERMPIAYDIQPSQGAVFVTYEDRVTEPEYHTAWLRLYTDPR